MSEGETWVSGENIGDAGDKVCVGTTNAEGGGMDMGPGCAGCVCARCRDEGDICSRSAGVSL